MRVTSDLFVSALLRRVFSSGGYGAVARRGAAEAGAVFLTLRDRTGLVTLYAPASQTDYGEGRPDDRRFALAMSGEDGQVEARIEKELRFDPDVWVVEIEPGSLPIGELLTITTP
ncbi:MAG: DUF1491 family protein [Rhizobiaceae bacterium]|nr:DUF1491 family protein [Rhizobiaceae bacterium]